MEPIETSNSDAKAGVLNAQNHRWRLGSIDKRHSGPKYAVFLSEINRRSLGFIETINSAANHAGLDAENDRWGLGPMETCNSGPKVAVLHSKTTNEGWDS